MPTPPHASRRRPSRVIAWAILGCLLCSSAIGLVLPLPAQAISASDLPASLPPEAVLDNAAVLSRAASGAIAQQLTALDDLGVEGRLITLPRLDYGVGLQQLGDQLLQQWQGPSPDPQLLLLLIDTQTNGAALVASPELRERLGPELLRSTARNTLAPQLRDGARYRQGSLEAINRLSRVLQGEADPGESSAAVVVAERSSVPSREETVASKAWIWITVLLVVGTLVPMFTWWVFSR